MLTQLCTLTLVRTRTRDRADGSSHRLADRRTSICDLYKDTEGLAKRFRRREQGCSPLQKVQAIGVRRGTRVTVSCPSFSFSWDCPDVFVTLHCVW